MENEQIGLDILKKYGITPNSSSYGDVNASQTSTGSRLAEFDELMGFSQPEEETGSRREGRAAKRAEGRENLKETVPGLFNPFTGLQVGQEATRGFAKGMGRTTQGVGELLGQPARIFEQKLIKEGIPEEQARKMAQAFSTLAPGGQATQADIFREGTEASEAFKEKTTPEGPVEKLGFAAESIAEFAVPGSKAGKLGRVGSSVGVASAQEGELGKDSLIAGSVEALAPGALKLTAKVLKPVKNLIGRIFTNLGSGLSGVSGESLTQIAQNPQTAKRVAKEIADSGQEEILRKNTNTVVKGIQRVRREASKAFGEGVEQLAKEDINPAAIKSHTTKAIQQSGIEVTESGLNFNSAEFTDPILIKRAEGLIGEIDNAKNLDGKSLRKLIDKVDKSRFRTAVGDEKLAYNAFVDDVAGGLKSAVKESTPKLDDINKAFSADKQLTESMERVFGKIEYGNAKEVEKAAEAMERLFTKKGLTPQAIDKFLTRVGVAPSDFRTSEAVRQIGQKAPQANTLGTGPFEALKGLTSAVVTPKTVGKIATLTGLVPEVLAPVLNKIAPTARAAFIRMLIGGEEN